MRVIPWELPFVSSWTRALDLKEMSYVGSHLVLLLEEEEGASWQLNFKVVQAIKITTEECAGLIFEKLPENGGLFEVEDSDWIKELGKGDFLSQSRHFIVCCYDSVIEVVSWEAEITRAG